MRNDKRFNELTEQHMKPSGKSDTVRGELIRAVNRIGYRFYNDGDQIGRGYGNETCNAAGRYIGKYGNDEMVEALGRLWDESILDSDCMMPDHVYEKHLNALIKAVVEYADSDDPELDEAAEDMLDYREAEDTCYDEYDELDYYDWDEEDEEDEEEWEE